MIEGIDITTLITAVPVIGVLMAWLASMRNQLHELQDRYDRLDSEYKQILREQAGHRSQQIINERLLGIGLSMSDSQKITPDMIAVARQTKIERESEWQGNN
jgi:hypothetical protein